MRARTHRGRERPVALISEALGCDGGVEQAMTETERHRHRHRQTETERDTQKTHRQTHTQRDTQRDTDRHRDTDTERKERESERPVALIGEALGCARGVEQAMHVPVPVRLRQHLLVLHKT
eukprot:1545539-Rhodomonas_salina.1